MDDIRLTDPLDRKVARNIARHVLTKTNPEDQDAAFNVRFADKLLEKVSQMESNEDESE